MEDPDRNKLEFDLSGPPSEAEREEHAHFGLLPRFLIPFFVCNLLLYGWEYYRAGQEMLRPSGRFLQGIAKVPVATVVSTMIAAAAFGIGLVLVRSPAPSTPPHVLKTRRRPAVILGTIVAFGFAIVRFTMSAPVEGDSLKGPLILMIYLFIVPSFAGWWLGRPE